MSDQVKAFQKTIAAVREQKRTAYAALVKIAQDNGFFNPEWGKDPDSWMDDLDADEESDRTIPDDELDGALHRQEAIAWSQWWVKFKEWDLLGQGGTPYPAQIQKLYDKFLALDVNLREDAKKLGDRAFHAKHPGFAKNNRLPRFPDEVIRACWAAEE